MGMCATICRSLRHEKALTDRSLRHVAGSVCGAGIAPYGLVDFFAKLARMEGMGVALLSTQIFH